MSETAKEETQEAKNEDSNENPSFISGKCSEMMKKISEEDTVVRGKEYIRENVVETCTGILLILAFILSIWFPDYGGGLVAFITGIIFSKNVVEVIGKCFTLYQTGALFKPFALAVFFVTALILHPYSVICFVVAVALRWIVQPKRHQLFKESKEEES